MLFDGMGRPIASASDWFRHLAVGGKTGEGTLEQYAKTVRNFVEYLEENSWLLEDVTDRILRKWRNRDHSRRGCKKKTCNAKLGVIYRFFLWAQSRGHFSYIIGVPEWSPGLAPPIAISIVSNEKRPHDRSADQITSDILFRVKGRPRLHVPTAEEMDQAYVRLSEVKNPAIAMRNTLLFTGAEITGGRRFELLGLRADQIPEWNVIYDLSEDDKSYPV
ncbi:site-specific integrase [Microvirga massiliensis]|uniref:site-specific integrase n=1 Tax=Microvirga massiliensis TaxID=1033741 RepID=UPI00062BDCDA|nr:site-specific integrase [Microvirga massiliensis]